MCPKCQSQETGPFVNKGREDGLLLNKCHECDCVFFTLNLEPRGGKKNVSK